MAENKTKKNEADVMAYLSAIEPEAKRLDSLAIAKLIEEVTGEKPSMWGETIVGYGEYEYQTADGKEQVWFAVGFAPRKQNLTLYIMPGFEQYQDLLQRLGKHKIGKSCLYINKLADVDTEVLRELVSESVKQLKKPAE